MTDFTSLLSHTNRWTDSEIVKKGKVEGHRDKKDSIPGDILYTTTKSVWTPMTTYVLKSLVWEQFGGDPFLLQHGSALVHKERSV